jgi:hypothetical protein
MIYDTVSANSKQPNNSSASWKSNAWAHDGGMTEQQDPSSSPQSLLERQEDPVGSGDADGSTNHRQFQ